MQIILFHWNVSNEFILRDQSHVPGYWTNQRSYWTWTFSATTLYRLLDDNDLAERMVKQNIFPLWIIDQAPCRPVARYGNAAQHRVSFRSHRAQEEEEEESRKMSGNESLIPDTVE